jgi:hypothetical protein
LTFTIDPQVINGHDAIICPGNGSDLAIAEGPSIEWGTGDFGIIAVARFGVADYIWEKVDPNGGGPGVALGATGGNYQLTAATNNIVLAGSTPTGFHIVAGRGAQLRLQADGNSTSGPTNTSSLDFVGSGGSICVLLAQANANTPVELAELILVKGTLSDGDLANAVSYLKGKFKL